MIRFNVPYIAENTEEYLLEALNSKRWAGSGEFGKKVETLLNEKFNFQYNLFTTNCTQAIEMAAMLIDIKPGDEVIIPSFTFVSTALPFEERGAKVIFIDSQDDHPNLNLDHLKQVINSKTKAILPVHYAGMACPMDEILELAKKNQSYVIEDAAQCINSTYKGMPLGTIGDFGCFSFHETKNIGCGEGGLLVCKEQKDFNRAEYLVEKGTNRLNFEKGHVSKYTWVDQGSSFRPSEFQAATLLAQIESLDQIHNKRVQIWDTYMKELQELGQKGVVELPSIPKGATNNGHLFYLVLNSKTEREGLISFLKSHSITAVFHYQALHKSPYYMDRYKGRRLINAEKYEDRLVRLPIFYDLDLEDAIRIANLVKSYLLR